MAFALSIDRLEQACKKDGCPICRLAHEAAVQSIAAFLWEHANDSQAREPVNKSLGLCPPHTRLLVASELSSSGTLPGVHMIYELLAKKASESLLTAQKNTRTTNFFRKLLPFMKTSRQEILKATGTCPICEVTGQSALNYLSTLYEQLPRNAELRSIYEGSDGICMAHIRLGNERFADTYPQSAELINGYAADALQKNRKSMLEYIRKQNWEYSDEALTADERVAWLKTLAFFTGYPASKFNHHIDEF